MTVEHDGFESRAGVTSTETCDLVAVADPGERAAGRRFALLVLGEQKAEVRLLTEGATLVVGREASCDIVVDDGSVSRQHARFSLRDGRVSVEDLDSRNGTLIQGRKIQSDRLEPGVDVHIGTSRFVLVARRADAPPSMAPGAATTAPVIQSPSMKKLYADAARAGRSTLPVLVLGETGVGKEHIASTLHRESDRREQPFVTVNCGAIAPSLIEATFFGHERGAFTGAVARSVGSFERASGGTLFLDEIGELPASAQAAMLRAIETRKIARLGSSSEIDVDIRVVAATHCNLEAMVEDGSFRQDLFFRLNAVRLDVPPLRERPDELEPLARYFIEKARGEWPVGVHDIAPDALEALRRYHWPGNVRQLRFAIERAALLCTTDTLRATDLPDYVFTRAVKKEQPSVAMLADLSLRQQLLCYERALIDEAMRRSSGNRAVAAKLLRIPVRTLFRRMRMAGAVDEAEG